MKTFNILTFIENLISFGERQGIQESKAAEFIMQMLKDYGVNYVIHNFTTQIPLIEKAILLADGEKIECKGVSFVSGVIKDKESIISSLIPSRFFIEHSNINFNPKAENISKTNYYFAPAIAINRVDISRVLKADEITGEVCVKTQNHNSVNILVGNNINPKKIIFAHYDSVETGATDNASGVGVLMDLIIKNPESLDENLFVFSGNEELSYDKPTYWGHGFRAFEDSYQNQIEGTKDIIVVDCVGNGKTNSYHDDNLKYLAFPILGIDKQKNKISVVCGDMDKLMKVYHSTSDDMSQVDKTFLDEAVLFLENIIKE